MQDVIIVVYFEDKRRKIVTPGKLEPYITFILKCFLNPLLHMTFQRSSALQSSDEQFQQSRKLKNIAIKGEIACFEQFHL